MFSLSMLNKYPEALDTEEDGWVGSGSGDEISQALQQAIRSGGDKYTHYISFGPQEKTLQ